MNGIRFPGNAGRGFTLVELLVGLALALLVVAGASTGLVVAQRRRNDAPTHL